MELYKKCHQNNNPKYPNREYVKEHKEAIYYGTKESDKDVGGKLNREPEDMGTYNFGLNDGIKHAALDIAPYILCGNSYSDTTTRWTRLVNSSSELRKDIWERMKKALGL